MKWLRATHQNPCPICQRADWCGYSEDGRLAICMRVPSDRTTRNGGYLHRLIDGPPKRAVSVRARVEKRMALDPQKVCNILKRTPCPNALESLGTELGVSVAALLDLRVVWAESHGAWAFPMRDGDGKVVGIRLRAVNGRKWAVRGSRDGLFYPERVPVDHVAVVCEGPTDTAAALTLGLWAVGRPSCIGGVDPLKALCRRLLVRYVIIVGDNDPPKARPGGGHWQPGIEGARKLIQALNLPCKLLVPPAKDLRAWVRAGAGREDFEALAHNQAWRF